ncbi:MAG: hypothetical protein ABI462_03835 [Ignavibacteria bacterium]
MKYSDDIFKLVSSLTKQEKSYFKKFAGSFSDDEGSNYLKFFNEIVSQDLKGIEYDEDKIRKIDFTGKFVKNLSYHKNYLYNMILSSVVFYSRDKKHYIQLNDLISQVEYLNEKSLYEQSLKILIKSKKAAYDTDSYPELLKIINLEKKIFNNISDHEDYEDKNKLLNDEQEKILDIIQSNLDIYKLYVRAGALSRQSGTGFLRKEEVSGGYKDIINSDVMKDESHAKSFQAKFMFKTIKLLYSLSVSDFETSNSCAEEIVTLIEDNFIGTADWLNKYIISLNNLISTQDRVMKFEESEITIRKMMEIENKYPDLMTGQEKVFVFYSKSVMLMTKYLQCGESDKLKVFLSEVIRGMDKYELKITMQLRIILYYFLGLSYFVISDFESCIKWMGKIINSERSIVSEDYQSHSRIVFLLSYYELKYFDSLEHVLKSTYHFLSKRKRVFKYENIILKYLRRSFRVKTEKELYVMFDEMQDELKKISDDPFEKHAFDTFNILYWLESKLQKKPLTEFLRERFLGES